MAVTTTQTGKKGEETACAFLTRKGFLLVCRNYRYEHREIDLVMRDADTLVFVEVKARSSVRFGAPAEFVTLRKQKHLLLAAQGYLFEHGLCDAPARFDVVEVYLDTGTVEHIENAFGLS